MAISDDIEVGEGLAILAVLAVVSYGAYSLYKKLTQDVGAHITGPAPFVGNGKALTYPQAQGIAQYIGVDNHGGSWQQSPDKIQIWFADGAYYDNADSSFHQADGTTIGSVIDVINKSKDPCSPCCGSGTCTCDGVSATC